MEIHNEPISVVQWNKLDHIDDLESVTDSDIECMKEIEKTLNKYNCSSKFGVALLHKHFNLEDDEIFVETYDPASRTLTARPAKRSSLVENEYTETIWKLDNGIKAIKSCDSLHIEPK